MNNSKLHLDQYKQQLADDYSQRGQTYDQSNWHKKIAYRLVEYAQLQPGQKVLDIATGTGIVAIEAANLVGSTGRVIGVDIAVGMLDQAKMKAQELDLRNVEFLLEDAEVLNFPNDSFDIIFCASALIWLVDIPSALRLWYKFLKPGGSIGFHAFAHTAFIGGVVARHVLKKHGVSLEFNQRTGTVEKCYELLASAGFEAIAIRLEQDGSYISLAQAEKMWSVNSRLTPGQFPHPLSHFSPEQLAQIQGDYITELARLETAQGIWNDITIFYCFARKPLSK
jgi:ubiquinone/menaquinone biosynthesis C-methylase UbiE